MGSHVRDTRIYQMQEMNVKRVMLLLRQFEFLQTKIQAYEEIIEGSLWDRFMSLIDWEGFRRRVDNRQKELLAERDRQFEQAMAKPVIKPVVVVGNG